MLHVEMTIPGAEIRRILCIKPRGIGDIVLSTIVLENLAAAFPEATIDYLAERFAVDALRGIPLVNEALGMEKGESLFSLVRRVRKGRYDCVIDLWSNPRTAQITLLSGARYRVGYAYRGRRYAYNLLGTGERGDHHSAEHNLELLAPLGVPIVSRRIHFATRPEDDRTSRHWLHSRFGERIPIGILPSGGWPSKRCPPSTWVAICQKLSERYGAPFLILWGPGDEKDAGEIREGIGREIDLAPPSSIGLMGSFLKECALVIANDSGPMHIAAALGVPTIGLFGPTDPRRHGPYGPTGGYVIKSDLHCIVCNKLECPYAQECMTQIPLDVLLAKADELAGTRLGGSPGVSRA
jgi:ADP-heptose:LPS heptosyltransferase